MATTNHHNVDLVGDFKGVILKGGMEGSFCFCENWFCILLNGRKREAGFSFFLFIFMGRRGVVEDGLD